MDELEDGMLEQLIRAPPEHPLHRPRHPRDTTIGPGPGDDVADIAQDHLVLLLGGRQLGQRAMLHRDVAHHRQRADPDTVLYGRGVGRLVHRKAVGALRDVDRGLATQCPLQQRPDPGKGARLQHLGHPAAEQACRVIPMHPRRAAQHGLIAHLRVDQQHTHERHRCHGRTHRPIGPAHDRLGPALPVHHHYPTVPTSGRGCRLDVYARRQTRVARGVPAVGGVSDQRGLRVKAAPTSRRSRSRLSRWSPRPGCWPRRPAGRWTPRCSMTRWPPPRTRSPS